MSVRMAQPVQTATIRTKGVQIRTYLHQDQPAVVDICKKVCKSCCRLAHHNRPYALAAEAQSQTFTICCRQWQ